MFQNDILYKWTYLLTYLLSYNMEHNTVNFSVSNICQPHPILWGGEFHAPAFR